MRKHKPSWPLTPLNFLRLWILLVAPLLPSAAYAVGGPPHCALATVAGNYAVTTLGQQAGEYAAAVFLMTSDGNGDLSGSGAESLNGTVFSNVTVVGTYTANSNCWFTATMTDSLGNISNFSGAIGQNGYELVGPSTDDGTQMQFIAYRLYATQCTLQSLAEKFGAQVQSPLTPSGSSTATQQWYLRKTGSGTGSWAANVNGTIVQGTATTTFSVNSDCTYTSTVTNSDGTTGHFFGIGGIRVNDVGWVSMATDSGWVSLATGYFTR